MMKSYLGQEWFKPHFVGKRRMPIVVFTRKVTSMSDFIADLDWNRFVKDLCFDATEKRTNI